MQTFTGTEYLKIDIANNFGLDKELFEDRLAWFTNNEHRLEHLVKEAEEPALFYAGVLAYRDTQKGIPTGYMVTLDACSSGLQLMAAMTGCRTTAMYTGLINTGKRPDIYTSGFHELKAVCEENDIPLMDIERKHTKKAIMTRFYGSKKTPEKIFGEDSPQLAAFEMTMKRLCPGPDELRQILLNLWRSDVYQHDWFLPDGFHAVCKVMNQINVQVTAPHFGRTIEIPMNVNMPKKHELSLAANPVHSVDGYIVRELLRRCYYDADVIQNAYSLLHCKNAGKVSTRSKDLQLLRLIELSERTNMVSVRMLDYIDECNAGIIPSNIREVIMRIVRTMQMHKSFPVVTIHDAFRAHPNNMNYVRWHYNILMAEIADSTLLQSIIRDISGNPQLTIGKLSEGLSKDILESNYMLS